MKGPGLPLSMEDVRSPNARSRRLPGEDGALACKPLLQARAAPGTLEEHVDLMIELIAMAMACDVVRYGTFRITYDQSFTDAGIFTGQNGLDFHALTHAGVKTRTRVKIHYIESTDIEKTGPGCLAGMDAILGLAFANTGVLYPFFGTLTFIRVYSGRIAAGNPGAATDRAGHAGFGSAI